MKWSYDIILSIGTYYVKFDSLVVNHVNLE